MWPPSSADIKAYLNIDGDNTDRDILITLARSAARARVEEYCGRKFLSETRTYYLDGTGTDTLRIPDWPISSVTSVVWNGDAPRDWTVDAIDSDYYQQEHVFIRNLYE